MTLIKQIVVSTGIAMVGLWIVGSYYIASTKTEEHADPDQQTAIHPDAYEHAQIALLRKNPRLRSESMSAFSPNRVEQMKDVFVVYISYESMNPNGQPEVYTAKCSLRLSNGVWVAISVPELPMYGPPA